MPRQERRERSISSVRRAENIVKDPPGVRFPKHRRPLPEDLRGERASMTIVDRRNFSRRGKHGDPPFDCPPREISDPFSHVRTHSVHLQQPREIPEAIECRHRVVAGRSLGMPSVRKEILLQMFVQPPESKVKPGGGFTEFREDQGELEVRVHPTMIPVNYPLADVNGAFNAIRLAGDFVGPVMFYGRGAGMEPTASAVIGDVVDIARNMLAGISRRCAPLGYLDERVKKLTIKPMGEIVSKYYIRFNVADRPGVLAKIASALGVRNISIESMVQSARSASETVPIVIMTHEAREMDVRKALEEIDAFDIIREKSNLIRIEDNLE